MDKIEPGQMVIGSAVTVPDGRAGVVRFVYASALGDNLIVRIEDASMLVVAASKCHLRNAKPPTC